MAVVLLVVLLVYFAEALVRRGRFGLGNTSAVRSSLDGANYRVHQAHGEAGRAADTMAELNGRVIALLRRLRGSYIRGGGRGGPRARAAERLLGLYNPDNLAENSPLDPDGDTSYVMSKGSVVALCLRERAPALSGGAAEHDFHDLNTLAFVTIHEMSHIAVEELDHPPEFWSAFKFLLGEAVAEGLYVPVDYERQPVQYCGMTVDYNPYFDSGLASF